MNIKSVMCNCYSPSWDIGLVKQDVLTPPGMSRSVSIDHCILDVIKHLWANDIATRGCCCGHNRMNPSVIIEDGASDERLQHVKRLISQVDDREWVVSAWRRVEV